MWTPPNEWEGQAAYLIGGGSSLKDFDFSVLKGRNTIGCNDAFRLGPEIVKYNLFGDTTWFHKVKYELEKTKVPLVTNSPGMINFNVPHIRKMSRERDGLFSGSTLGWNYSTGAAAINLAISLGATWIFLLGYDLTLSDKGKSHWHNHRVKVTTINAFHRFLRGFQEVQRNLKKYPRSEERV